MSALQGPTLASIGAGSPLLQMLGTDSPDGMVCDVNGVCAIPGLAASDGPVSAGDDSSTTQET
ncbi:hypothetical protein [Subtercola vilae]|uniref:Uncharacterized protein n=1 Tax=Subtercola vilae TaxID=2056433 RepID=A0A4T2C672_9MICO|nr:hypothetical protein [Subtercola vilae]TIH39915.1 hypothetical protein D4765_03910 [Subtercola vilae]